MTVLWDTVPPWEIFTYQLVHTNHPLSTRQHLPSPLLWNTWILISTGIFFFFDHSVSLFLPNICKKVTWDWQTKRKDFQTVSKAILRITAVGQDEVQAVQKQCLRPARPCHPEQRVAALATAIRPTHTSTDPLTDGSTSGSPRLLCTSGPSTWNEVLSPVSSGPVLPTASHVSCQRYEIIFHQCSSSISQLNVLLGFAILKWVLQISLPTC